MRAYFQVVARVLLTLIDQYLTPMLSSLRSYRTQHRFVANPSALFRLFSSAFRHFGPSWSLPGLFFRREALVCPSGPDLFRYLTGFHNPGPHGGYA